MFRTLCHEIIAARLKVTKQLGTGTSPTVNRLARMKLPPVIRLDYCPHRLQLPDAALRYAVKPSASPACANTVDDRIQFFAGVLPGYQNHRMGGAAWTNS